MPTRVRDSMSDNKKIIGKMNEVTGKAIDQRKKEQPRFT
jgi:hypothetical protein